MLVLTDDRSADRPVEQSSSALGGEGEIAAGPVGRCTTAQTDAKFTAEILSWARARGVFAGITVKGATLRQDIDDNEAMYISAWRRGTSCRTRIAPTAAGRKLMVALDRHVRHAEVVVTGGTAAIISIHAYQAWCAVRRRSSSGLEGAAGDGVRFQGFLEAKPAGSRLDEIDRMLTKSPWAKTLRR